MPIMLMREITTPLKLVGIKFFKCDDGSIYIKFGAKHRKKIF
jgi:hypothetical protein